LAQQTDLSILDPILEKLRSRQGALVTMLQEIQKAYGYLPEAVLERLSRETQTPLSRIYGVITFYSQFYLTPRGRNIIRVCDGTACHVRSSEFIRRTLADALGLQETETTEDMQFSLETAACFGTCFLAPVMMVNSAYHGKLDPQQALDIIEGYAQSEDEN
tara:strand:- start:42 stop:524 length:483 start_codon:yes stop_codon:yes gene_type:complete